MLKAAVIGVGSMGRNHARVYSAMDGVELVAVADAYPETAQSMGDLYGVPGYHNYERLLDEAQPDLVTIATPTVTHHATARAAMSRGAHVLIEKPIAYTVDEARDLITYAEQQGVVLTVGHIERFNPAIAALKERLDSEELGTIFRIQAQRMGPFPARIQDVGVTIDLATHDIDIMRYVLSADVTRLYAETAQNIHTSNEDTMDATLRFDNDTIGTLNINWLTPTKIRELTVAGAKGMYRVNYITQELYFFENEYAPTQWEAMRSLKGMGEGAMIRYKVARYEPLRAELERFVACARGEARPLISGEDGMKALAAAQMLVRSGRDGVAITL